MENLTQTIEQPPLAIEKMKKLFADNIEKRICVVGSSCVGKSTLLHFLPEAIDMDDLLFGNKQKGNFSITYKTKLIMSVEFGHKEVGQFMTQKLMSL